MRSLLVALAVAVAATASASAGQERARFRPVARGFDDPVYVTGLKSEPGRLYVVEQPGRIVVLEKGKRRIFLDIRRLVRSGGEQGLLSVAFHPRYARNHRFYVNYTNRSGDTRVVEYRSSSGRAVPSSARVLFGVDQPYPNHNGGQLQFGPDGMLYVGMGDGGAGGDPQNRAQSSRSLLGKLLSIDVDRAGAKPEIDAYGLRNPWRFSFDRANGDLYIGDVGQGDWEEIDYLPEGTIGKEVVNFGWSRYEGRASYDPSRSFRSDLRLVAPIAVYAHRLGCSVTGGYVYRGSSVPALRGRYVYGDYCTGLLWSLRPEGARAAVRREAGRIGELSSFGEDGAGELYATSLDGTLYRLSS